MCVAIRDGKGLLRLTHEPVFLELELKATSVCEIVQFRKIFIRKKQEKYLNRFLLV